VIKLIEYIDLITQLIFALGSFGALFYKINSDKKERKEELDAAKADRDLEIRLDKEEREEQQKKNDTHWANFYRSELINFHERLTEESEWVPTYARYETIYANFTSYKKLGENGFIDDVMKEIRGKFLEHY